MNSRIAMIASIGVAAGLPRQLETVIPTCACDTFINGLTLEDLKSYGEGRVVHGCMRWSKNNPHLTDQPERLVTNEGKLIDGFQAPATPENPEGLGYQTQCSKADPGLKTGAASEFEKDWQGGCPSDMVKCELFYQTPQELVSVCGQMR